MPPRLNAYGQPIGPAVINWTSRPRPTRQTFRGRFCRLEPLDTVRHAPLLFSAYSKAVDTRDWTYLPSGPFKTLDSYQAYAAEAETRDDPLHFAVVDTTTDRPVGTLGYLHIQPDSGSIEVGHVAFSHLLKRTPASTEAQFLLMRHAFDDLGYRRYEWKCDSLNAASRRTALRLGFVYEGTFRNATVYHDRSRDTTWFSITNTDWPLVRAAIENWLSENNFDKNRHQRQSLEEIRGQLNIDFLSTL